MYVSVLVCMHKRFCVCASYPHECASVCVLECVCRSVGGQSGGTGRTSGEKHPAFPDLGAW